VPDARALLEHWGYAGIALAVLLGNIGFPLPEETTLAVAGYAAARGELHLPTVIAVAMISAVVGDNLGYWFGRRYGRAAIGRYGRSAFITPQRLQKISRFVERHGAFAVFLARFVMGARFLAGPLAGAGGLPPLSFAIANFLGALIYVPYAVGIGYAIGYGFGDAIEHGVGTLRYAALAGIFLLTLVIAVSRWLRSRSARGTRPYGPL
jgi:membrane protein DedA with SNARE-associated domain